MEFLQPPGWERPAGYSNGVAVGAGRLVFVSGQIGWNAQKQFEATDLVGQTRQALQNALAVLAEAGGRPDQIVRMTWYLVDKRDYMAQAHVIGRVYRELVGPHYPAMTAVEVRALIEDEALVEIEITAVLP